jgi:hypothetical protein
LARRSRGVLIRKRTSATHGQGTRPANDAARSYEIVPTARERAGRRTRSCKFSSRKATGRRQPPYSFGSGRCSWPDNSVASDWRQRLRLWGKMFAVCTISTRASGRSIIRGLRMIDRSPVGRLGVREGRRPGPLQSFQSREMIRTTLERFERLSVFVVRGQQDASIYVSAHRLVIPAGPRCWRACYDGAPLRSVFGE